MDSVILTTSSLELWTLSEASRLLLKLKSTDEYCYILFSAFQQICGRTNKDVKAEIKREKSVSDGFQTDLFSTISL